MDSINEHKFPWTGSSTIVDEFKKASDMDGSEMDLFKGKYKMVSSVLDVIVRKGKDANRESYDLLRTFRHDSAIPLLDIYTEFGEDLCLVIPEVDGSFKTWFKLKGCTLFDSNGHMTTLLLDIIIAFAGLIESLHKSNLVIENFSMDNIFVNDLKNSQPKICILLVEVKKVKVLGAVDRKHNWDYVREFMSWCEDGCDVKRDSLTKSFCDFIGESFFTVEKLRLYPHNWDWEMKGQYLMSLVAGNHGKLRYALSGDDNLHWPFENTERKYHNLPSIIRQLLEWEDNSGRDYNILDSFGYIILLRNCFKHYKKFPEDIKVGLMKLSGGRVPTNRFSSIYLMVVTVGSPF